MNVGGYQIVEELARGGMGVVFRARAPGVSRDVALKLLHTGRVNDAQRERFRREAEVTARLEHPGIVRVHGAGTAGEQAYVAYELIEGAQTLSDLLPRVSQERSLELIEEVALALGHAHQQGVVHRDVKPENVLITPEGAAKVADFGVAQAPGLDRMTQTGQLVGTPHYMAPEQFGADRSAMGPATDVWALGVILYEALTGQLPFQGDTFVALGAQVAHGLRRPPSAVAPAVTRALDAVCAAALNPDVSARYPNAAAFAADLQRARTGERPLAQARSKRAFVAFALGAGLLSLLALGAAFLWGGSNAQPAPSKASVDPPAGEPVEATPTPAVPPGSRPRLRRGLLTEFEIKAAGHDVRLLFVSERELAVFEPGRGPGGGVKLWELDESVESAEEVQAWGELRPAHHLVPDPRGGFLCATGSGVSRLLHNGRDEVSSVLIKGARYLAVSPSGDLLGLASSGGIRLVQRGVPRPLRTWPAAQSPPQAIQFLDEDRLAWVTGGAALSGHQNLVHVWNGAHPERDPLKAGAHTYIRDFAWIPERGVLVLACDRVLPVVSVGEELKRAGNLLKPGQTDVGVLAPTFAVGPIRAMWLSADRRRLAVLASGIQAPESEIACWDPISGELVGEPKTFNFNATQFAFSPDETLLALYTDKRVKVYNAERILSRE